MWRGSPSNRGRRRSRRFWNPRPPEEDAAAAAPAASRLSDDLLEFSIFSRLPAKVLMRLKCVCKSWHRIITNRHPLLVHTQSQLAASCIVPCRSTPPPDRYLSADRRSIGIPTLEPLRNTDRQLVVASSNGILCIFHIARVYLNCSIVIGNPSLKDWELIPTPYSILTDEQYAVSGYSVFGLAVDVGESSVKYKLALVTADKVGTSVYHLHVFSSTSKEWRMWTQRLELPSRCVHRVAVRVKDTLYWKLLTSGGRVLWFNIEEEVAGVLPQTLPLPELTSSSYACNGQLGECGGKLSYALVVAGVLHMWSLDDSHWSMKVSITLSNPRGRVLKALVPSHQNKKLKKQRDISTHSFEVYMIPFQGGDSLSFFWGKKMYTFGMRMGVIQDQSIQQKTDCPWFPYKNSLVSVRTKEENVEEANTK